MRFVDSLFHEVSPASTIASYVTSSNIRSCGSILLACLAWTPKNVASNFDRSFSFPDRVGSPRSPKNKKAYRTECSRVNTQSIAMYAYFE